MPKTNDAREYSKNSNAADSDRRPVARDQPLDESPRSRNSRNSTPVGSLSAAVERIVRALPAVPQDADRPLIVHSHLRWDFVWQRPQQIFSRLAQRHRVLFTEEPMEDDGPPRLIVTEPYPNVFRAVPVLPRGAHAGADAQWAATLPMLQHALSHHPLLCGQFESPVQWFYSPMTAPHFLGRFGADCVVYDCMDELANFRFAPPDIAQREQLLIRHADVVFTGGYRLFESKSNYHDNVHFYGCGVDVAHYGTARLEQTVVPQELADLPGPVFGYFGVIDERIDYDLIDRLAAEFSDASVAMVGPVVKVDPAMLPSRPNIHWFGQRSYDELPALVKGFDVCLMPFAMNESTQFINPTKTLEYMAAGKPIVSTAVPDVLRNFTPIVEVATDHDGFVDAVGQAYRAPCAELLARGLERARQASWESTVQAMRKHVLAALEARTSASARPVAQTRSSGSLVGSPVVPTFGLPSSASAGS
jgi:glycosyltransferase involved in cell wall biosynthesis